jgi:dTDP-glucose pyrophosphorylase
MQPTLLILAAGIGSRYGGLKQVDGIGPGGEAILEYSVFDAIRAGFGKVVFVIRRDIEAAFREKVGRRIEPHIRVEYAFQEHDTALEWLQNIPKREKPWGTGHAVLAARQFLTEPFATINADDFYGADAFRALGRFLQTEARPDRYAMVAYRLANTLSENGAVSRGVCTVDDDGYLANVVERTKIERFEDGITYLDEQGQPHVLAPETPVSMNLWGFHPSVLPAIDHQFRAFVETTRNNPRAEFYIPTVVNNLLQAGAIKLQVLNSDSQWYGVTYPADKETVQQALRAMTERGLYPQPLWQ